MTHHQQLQAPKSLRAVMSVAAALCVLGLASLVFIHAPDVALTTDDTPATAAADTSRARPPETPGGAWTNNVPQADTVFGGKGYRAPEEPIAQF
ncbi:MAG TPA: hypothetical protein VFQ93_02485 [Casimicrobiaceae bacterium]|nr:hypothetical protein [Casimicrobiaceae bacterium]